MFQMQRTVSARGRLSEIHLVFYGCGLLLFEERDDDRT